MSKQGSKFSSSVITCYSFISFPHPINCSLNSSKISPQLKEMCSKNCRLTSNTGKKVAKTVNVLILYVGGTIGMQKNSEGEYVPLPNAFFNTMRSNPTMHDPTQAKTLHLKPNQLVLPESNDHFVVYELIEYDPLLDSSNMSTDDWIKIAKDLKKHYSNYNGFVVVQGTDTMAYTTSALSFMLENLQKPVIVTGAQVPLFELITDARDNLIESLVYAGCFPQIHEVALCFDRKLFRGNRSVKKCNCQFDAFDSPNFPTLANTGVGIQIHEENLNKANCTSCQDSLLIFTDLNRNVGSFYIFPTFTSFQLESFLKSPLEGLVLHTYGVGNIPSNRRDVIDILTKAVKRGVVIVNVTVCYQGNVSDAYETGKVLEKIGVLSGYDMTPEAALTKLIYVLGKAKNYDARVKMLKTNLRGEFTEICDSKTKNDNNISNNSHNNS